MVRKLRTMMFVWYSCVFQIKTNPYMYDHHVELITLLKAAGDFDKLRAAREAMNLIFPLTEGTTVSKPKLKC